MAMRERPTRVMECDLTDARIVFECLEREGAAVIGLYVEFGARDRIAEFTLNDDTLCDFENVIDAMRGHLESLEASIVNERRSKEVDGGE